MPSPQDNSLSLREEGQGGGVPLKARKIPAFTGTAKNAGQ